MPLVMRRGVAGIALASALALAAGCDFEGSQLPPTEGRCAQAPGPLLDCPAAPIETPEDACRKLLECGAIVLENEDGGGDYFDCLDFLEGLPGYRLDFALACVETSTCDDLKVATCLEHGDDG